MATYEAPTLLNKPLLVPVTEEEANRYQLVLFDLETTSLDTKTTEICQISAFTPSVDSEPWSVYALPTRGIDPRASAVNHLTVRVTEDERVLMKDDAAVETVTIEEALQQFLAYLSNCCRPPHTSILLVAHNGLNFDAPILIRAFKRSDVPYKQLTIACADSLRLCRDKKGQLEQYYEGKVSCRLENLYSALFDKTFPAHDAVEDVKALHEILVKLKLDKVDLLSHSDTFESLEKQLAFKDEARARLGTYPRAIAPSSRRRRSEDQISHEMAKRSAESGLVLDDFKEAYECMGEDGIDLLLTSARPDGKPRVTKHKKTKDRFIKYFNDENVCIKTLSRSKWSKGKKERVLKLLENQKNNN